jgi:hypothetical protein
MGEPGIHIAIVCASLSCPDLRREPFRAKVIDRQLDEQAKNFINNETKGVRTNASKLRISKIFDWFEEDFRKAGGVKAFIRRYHPDVSDASRVQGYLSYHWELNG